MIQRKIEKGSVFVCISGAVSDGHTYIEQVAEKGAAAVIVEKDVEAPEGLTVIKVKDTRYALAMTSAAYFGYPAEKLKSSESQEPKARQQQHTWSNLSWKKSVSESD